ncbi:MAG: flagellar protein FlgN [Clostridiales bacterium]|nr:flagellar protein FlgN [Clostridiales bacterium]
MASLIEELIDVLDKELDIYQQLIPISNEKTQIIIKNDLTELQAITDKEQLAVDQISALEHKRDTIMENIKIVINRKSSDNLNLKTLIQLLEGQTKEQKKLSILHDKLNTTIGQLMENNRRNKSLIEQSLEMIEFNLNVIQSSRMAQGNNYTKDAAQYNAKASGTGMFDAKQ